MYSFTCAYYAQFYKKDCGYITFLYLNFLNQNTTAYKQHISKKKKILLDWIYPDHVISWCSSIIKLDSRISLYISRSSSDCSICFKKYILVCGHCPIFNRLVTAQFGQCDTKNNLMVTLFQGAKVVSDKARALHLQPLQITNLQFRRKINIMTSLKSSD